MSSPLSPAERLPTDWKSDAMRKRIARRYAAERRFRLLGLGAVLLSAAFLAFLLVTMMGNGLRGFTRTTPRRSPTKHSPTPICPW